jgi:hypothetical protein
MPALKLGDAPHVSGLSRRIAQLSGGSERGANHYRRDFHLTLPADLPAGLGCESAVDRSGP